MKNVGSNKAIKGIADQLNLRELKIEYPEEEKNNEEDIPQEIKNYDFVHSNIGTKPK